MIKYNFDLDSNLEKLKYSKAMLFRMRIMKRYFHDDTIVIWGKKYFFKVILGNKNSFSLEGDTFIVSLDYKSTSQERNEYVLTQLAFILKKEIDVLLPKWEKITGFHFAKYEVDFKDYWGCNNKEERKLHLSWLLIFYPKRCLEKVIVHELVHFYEHHHNNSFYAYMDLYMPDWRKWNKILGRRRFKPVGVVWDKVVKRAV